MDKLTSYQKLKAENKRLKQDIYVLVKFEKSTNPNELMEHFSTRMNWDIIFDLEERNWSGETTKLNDNG